MKFPLVRSWCRKGRKREDISGPLGPSDSSAHTQTMILDKSLNLSEPRFSHLSNGYNSHFLSVSQGLCEGQMGKHFERQQSCVCPGLPGAGLSLRGKMFGDLQTRVGLYAIERVWASPSSREPSQVLRSTKLVGRICRLFQALA